MTKDKAIQIISEARHASITNGMIYIISNGNRGVVCNAANYPNYEEQGFYIVMAFNRGHKIEMH